MSELADLVNGIDKIRLRQSREIARAIDRHNAALKARTEAGPEKSETDEDLGYDFTVALIAVALDRTPAEVTNLGGSIIELPGLIPRIMELAGFAAGEERPATSPSIVDSSGSMAASPPAMATRPRKSAK